MEEAEAELFPATLPLAPPPVNSTPKLEFNFSILFLIEREREREKLSEIADSVNKTELR